MSASGSNNFLNIEDANLRVRSGNVHALGMTVGGITVGASFGLQSVTNSGNTTSNTLQFTNATTGLVTTANVTVGRDLTVSGNVSYTSKPQISVESNVVAEYTGPHDRPLQKYPEVALTSATTGGYIVTESGTPYTEQQGSISAISNTTVVSVTRDDDGTVETNISIPLATETAVVMTQAEAFAAGNDGIYPDHEHSGYSANPLSYIVSTKEVRKFTSATSGSTSWVTGGQNVVVDDIPAQSTPTEYWVTDKNPNTGLLYRFLGFKTAGTYSLQHAIGDEVVKVGTTWILRPHSDGFQGWRAFDEVSTTEWITDQTAKYSTSTPFDANSPSTDGLSGISGVAGTRAGSWVKLELPKKIRLQKTVFQRAVSDQRFDQAYVYGSNDDTNWYQLSSITSPPYEQRGSISAISSTNGDIVSVTRDDGVVEPSQNVARAGGIAAAPLRTQAEAQAAQNATSFSSNNYGPFFWRSSDGNIRHVGSTSDPSGHGNWASNYQTANIVNFNGFTGTEAWVTYTGSVYTFFGAKTSGSFNTIVEHTLGSEVVKVGTTWILRPHPAVSQSIISYSTDTITSYKYFVIQITSLVNNVGTANIGQAYFYGHEEGSGSLDTTLKSVYNAPGTQQLEVYYDAKDLVDGAVTSVTDLSPNTNNGTVSGDPQVSNGAFVFDGVGDSIGGSVTNGTGELNFTISMWVKPNVLDNSPFLFGENTNTKGFGIDISSAILNLFVVGGTAQQYNTSDLLHVGEWSHLIFYRNNGEMSIYKNGIYIYPTIVGSGALDLNVNTQFTVGSRDTSDYFTGSIANFRLFSKVLNAGQVQELYDYQKDYFLGTRSSVTLYKGHLGVGVAEPSGQLELAGDERIQEYPPRGLTGYETLVEGHGVFCTSASSNFGLFLGVPMTQQEALDIALASGYTGNGYDERIFYNPATVVNGTRYYTNKTNFNDFTEGRFDDYIPNNIAAFPGYTELWVRNTGTGNASQYFASGYKGTAPPVSTQLKYNNAFNKNDALTDYWESAASTYTSTSGGSPAVSTSGSTRLASNTPYGPWISLKLPYEICLKSYEFTGPGTKSPKEGQIWGTTDGTTWSHVHTFTDGVADVKNNETVSGNTNYYSEYAFITTKITGADTGARIVEVRYFGTPGPTTLDKGSLSLTRSLDVPRISRYDVDTETPRPEKLLLDFDTTVNSSPKDISGKGNHGAFYNGASYSAADKAFKFVPNGISSMTPSEYEAVNTSNYHMYFKPSNSTFYYVSTTVANGGLASGSYSVWSSYAPYVALANAQVSSFLAGSTEFWIDQDINGSNTYKIVGIKSPTVVAEAQFIKSESISFVGGFNPFTISFWVNVKVNTGHIGLTQYGVNASNDSIGLKLVNGQDEIEFFFYSNDVRFTWTPVVNRWYHLVANYDGGTDSGVTGGQVGVSRKIWVDGVELLVAPGSRATAGTVTQPSLPANSALNIGARIGGTEPVNGKISNFKLYNVALEASEVQKLYRLGRTGRYMVISDTAVGIGKVPEAQLDVRGTIKGVNMTECPVYFVANRQYQGVTNTGGAIIWNYVGFNQGGGLDTSNGRFTAPIRGIYMFSHFVGSYSTDPPAIRYQINGSDTNANNPLHLITGKNQNSALPGDSTNVATVMIKLDVGDYIYTIVASGTAAFQGNGGYGGFNGFYLSSW